MAIHTYIHSNHFFEGKWNECSNLETYGVRTDEKKKKTRVAILVSEKIHLKQST